MLAYLVAEGANLGIIPLGRLVAARRIAGHLPAQLAALGDPLGAPAVHDSRIRVAEQLEHPECIGRPPVVLVAVEDDGRVVADALGRQQLLETRAVEIVAYDWVVQVGDPVDLDCAWDVALVVKHDVLVALDDPYLWVVQMIGDPAGIDQHLGAGIFCHDGPPWLF